MTARLWSLNALAVELGMDRRTVAARLRGVRPDGSLKGHPAWFLTTALRAVGGPRRSPAAAPAPELPPWLEAVDELAPGGLEKGYCVALMSTIYQAPLLVATMAIRAGAGLSMRQAFEVSDAVSAKLLHHLFEDARRAGIEPFASGGDEGPAIICPDAFAPIDWRRLAAEAGEPGWTPPRHTPIWPDLAAAEPEA
jgi:hypothetical protein